MNQTVPGIKSRIEQVQSEALIRANSYRSSRFITIVAFLSGLGLMINVRIGVRLSLTELFAPFLFVAMAAGLNRLLANPVVRNLIFFVGLNLVGIVVSDMLGDVPFADSMRGIAKPVFILLLFINFGLLFIQGLQFIIPIYFGFILGALLHLFFNTGDDQFDFTLASMDYAFFVFRVSALVSLTAGLAGFFLLKIHRSLMLIAISLGMGVSVVFSGRSAVVVWLSATIALYFATRSSSVDWVSVLYPRRKMVSFVISSIALGILSYFAYAELATSGFLPESSKQKLNREQLENEIGFGPIGLLMAGRAEVVGSILMIYDSPIIGHGTSSMCGEYFLRAYRLAGQKKISEREIVGMVQGRVVTGHSILFHSWASHGILVLPLWIYVLMSLFRSLTIMVMVKSLYAPLFVLQIIGVFWDVFFSPLSVNTRAWIPLLLAFFAFYIPHVQQHASFQLAQLNKLRLPTTFKRNVAQPRARRLGQVPVDDSESKVQLPS